MTQKKIRSVAFSAVALAGLFILTACGGNSSTPSAPAPTPSTTGPVTIFPGTSSVPVGGIAQFQAFLASAPNATFTWSVTGGSANGSISATGLYTAPATIPTPAAVTITATSSGATAMTGTATINIAAAPIGGIVLNRSIAVLPAGGNLVFSATVSGAPITPTWQVNGVTGGDGPHGTIAANGLYTAPRTPPPGGSTTITALNAGNSASATVVVVFSNASLSGPYAFSYTGTDARGLLAVAGSFTAVPGTGTLSGIEDYDSAILTTPAKAVAISGTFTINPDGSGNATVNNPTGITGTATWHFTLVSSLLGSPAQHAILARFDTTATGAGAMDQQTPAQFTLASFSGNYAFELSGVDPSHVPVAMAGKFMATGVGGTLTSAEEDINRGGTNTQSAPDTSLHGTFSLDNNFPGSGRGTAQLINTSTQFPGTFNFAFYMVDSTHLKLVETDAVTIAFLSGDFFSGPGVNNGSFSNAVLTGNYVFTVAGSNISGSQLYSAGGVFHADGIGTGTGGVLDRNGALGLHLDELITGITYSVDPGLGRASIQVQDSSTIFNFAGYKTSVGSFVLVELDSNIVATGTAFLQAGTPAVQGNFAANLSGVVTSGVAGQEIIGQIFAPSTAAVLQGNIDIDSSGTVTSGLPLGTTSTIASADTFGTGTATLTTTSVTLPIVYYIVNANTVLVISADTSRVMVGALLKQF